MQVSFFNGMLIAEHFSVRQLISQCAQKCQLAFVCMYVRMQQLVMLRNVFLGGAGRRGAAGYCNVQRLRLGYYILEIIKIFHKNDNTFRDGLHMLYLSKKKRNKAKRPLHILDPIPSLNCCTLIFDRCYCKSQL